MTEIKKHNLTFQFLDDIVLAVQKGRVDLNAIAPRLLVTDIGPLTELLIFERSTEGVLVLLASMSDSYQAMAVLAALGDAKSGLPVYQENSATGQSVGFISTAHGKRDGLPWDDFCLKARLAAGRSGLGGLEARALIGAMIEIEENVHRHSGREQDGIVGFSSVPDRFEFVVADNGAGVLDSLRTHSDYADLSDSGSALRIALDNGNSRFGRSSGHGMGFNTLFMSLAALNGTLRFRSGDHALTISGVGPKLVQATTFYRPHIQGMLASVACGPLQASLLH